MKLSHYRNNFEFIKYYYNKSNKQNLSKMTSEIAVAINVPCIVVAHFLKEIAGDSFEINETIASLMKQYNYKEVTE